MTMDGGLERLVRILYEFCICPAPPENPAILYGLIPPNSRPPKLAPALNPHSSATKPPLPPQNNNRQNAANNVPAPSCITNTFAAFFGGERTDMKPRSSSWYIRCRRMLLEAWLANKGFAVGPSSSATGLPRESRNRGRGKRLLIYRERCSDNCKLNNLNSIIHHRLLNVRM